MKMKQEKAHLGSIQSCPQAWILVFSSCLWLRSRIVKLQLKYFFSRDLCVKADGDGRTPEDVAYNDEVRAVILRFRSEDGIAPGQNVVEMFTSSSSSVSKAVAAVSPLPLSPAARICLGRVLSLYVSVFSIHYIKESLKFERNKENNNCEADADDGRLRLRRLRLRPRRRFSAGPGLSCPLSGNPLVSFDVVRADSVAAADLRAFNLLRELAGSPAVVGFCPGAKAAIALMARR